MAIFLNYVRSAATQSARCLSHAARRWLTNGSPGFCSGIPLAPASPALRRSPPIVPSILLFVSVPVRSWFPFSFFDLPRILPKNMWCNTRRECAADRHGRDDLYRARVVEIPRQFLGGSK